MNNYCTHCGSPLNGDTTCSSCGSVIDNINEYGVEDKKTNIFCIVAFIVSLLGSGFIGIILSIISLIAIKPEEKGKGYAIAGIVIGVVKIVLIVIGLIFLKFSVAFFQEAPSCFQECTRIDNPQL